IANTAQLADPILLKEIVRLKKEAENFAANRDFPMALIWMETIWELLVPGDSSEPTIEESSEAQRLQDLQTSNILLTPRKFRWTKELITGIDIWRQEFQFTFLEGDSTFLDGSGNPFSGVRAAFEYNPSSRRSLQTLMYFKYSRDYLSGEIEVRLRNPLGQHSLWRFENRFEGSSFYRDFDVKYLQNRATLALDLKRLGPISLDLKDEFLFRNYANSTSSYPNYLNNMASGFVKLNTNLGSYLGVGYRNILRAHPDFGMNDYFENRFDFSWYQTLGRELSFAIENDLHFRDYSDAPTDTIFQDYWEDYFRGEFKLPFAPAFGSEIEGTLTRRDYRSLSSNLPDYWLWEVEPRFYVKVGPDWQLAAGGYYGELTQQTLANTPSILFEDYYMYGPTITIDFFRIDGLIFNMQQSLLWQRYPKSRESNVTNVALYSDRQVYSILFFLTWNISTKWRFTALANMDDDRSRQRENSDSNNTLLGFELNYLF
ncbi:MAG TPA: hypothetical protein VGA99_04980, partial [bacterium]